MNEVKYKAEVKKDCREHMSVDLLQLADTVIDEPTFLRFMHELAADWRAAEEAEAKSPSSPCGPSALGWGNWSFGAIIEASVAWAEASVDRLRFYDKPANPWRRMAQILAMGKFYE